MTFRDRAIAALDSADGSSSPNFYFATAIVWALLAIAVAVEALHRE